MSHRRLNIEELRDLINTNQAKDPLVFLESVMNGQDPRQTSAIYDLIMEIDGWSGGDISKEDWTEIIDHVSKFYKYKTVTLNESLSASKTLAEYLYAKKKTVDINSGNQGNGDISKEPLTEDEIELFKEVWNDEF